MCLRATNRRTHDRCLGQPSTTLLLGNTRRHRSNVATMVLLLTVFMIVVPMKLLDLGLEAVTEDNSYWLDLLVYSWLKVKSTRM